MKLTESRWLPIVLLTCSNIFHFGTYTVGDVKKFLAKKNIAVRL
jgi:imidazole glycerol phosphate synthase subunit HisF